MIAVSSPAPLLQYQRAETATFPSAQPAPQPSAKTINWLLIGIAAGYLVLSAVHLPSSIWVRAVLFSILVIRMKPDVILPLLMVTPQLRWLFLTQAERGDSFDVLRDVYEQLTGVEQYAFTIPIILIPIRVALAWSSSHPAGFPSRLFVAWLAGGLLVAFNTFLQMGAVGSWALAIRTYSVIGMYFFGMLLPPISDRELKKLVAGVMVLALPLYAIGLAKGSATQLLYVVSPLAVGAAVQGLTSGRASIKSFLLSAAVLAIGTFFSTQNHSMMHAVVFTYAAICVFCLVAVPLPSGMRRGLANISSITTLISILVLMTLAIYQFHVDAQVRRQAVFEGTGDYVGFKLFEERATIWYGYVRHVLTKQNPIMPVYGEPFEVQVPGRNVAWGNTPHNLLFAVLRLYGFLVGGIVFMVLGHMLIFNTHAIWLRPYSLWAVIGLAAVASTLVGGLTLEYVITEWQAEWFLALAGMTAAVAISQQREGGRRQVSAGRLVHLPPI
jgi:hypothetical protein